jgi:peptide-methionine (R)-S-oxide reductase
MSLFKNRTDNPDDARWREELSDEQYKVLREKGTERPFTGEYVHTKDDGIYRCAACGNELFSSDTKFDSGTGWPSFTDPAVAENVKLHDDNSHFMRRTEVTCANYGGHLGHVFPDGPNGCDRYCINSVSLKLDPADQDES